MRIFKILIVSLFMVLGVFGVAHAVTFDGTNHNPSYTEGITEVYAVTDNGIPVYVPVWSMERCIHEDGSSQVACVWHSPTQGNKNGAVSFMKLGGNEFATISHEAARILLAENSNVQVNYVPENVEVPENVVEFSGALPYNENAINNWTKGYAPCQFEDSFGCYWDADTMGNGQGVSFVVDANGNYTFGKA